MSARKRRWQHYRAGLPLFSRLVLSFTINRLYKIRNDYASRYIYGYGYEIGAQNSPVKCRNADKVQYIDYLSRRESALKYNIPEQECVEVDIIADANDLGFIPANSASFIIANHVLEHSPNPIGALLDWLRILEKNGRIFLTLPNYKSNEFDFEKKPTSIAHLMMDYEKAARNEDIITEHIHEHIRLIDGIDQENISLFQKRYQAILESNLHTHYHVFDRKNVLEMMQIIHNQIPITLVDSFSFDNSFELLFIIEKTVREMKGSLNLKQDKFFNFLILCKHMMPFLHARLTGIIRKKMADEQV